MPDLYLAIDIGGTKLTAGIVDEGGAVVIRDRVATPPARRVGCVGPARETCGCGIAGASGGMWRGLWRAHGSCQRSGLAPVHPVVARGFALRDLLVELTGLPTLVETDAKAIAAGEAWHGAGRGIDDFIGVVVATGVSGGIISGGRLLQGRVGNAGNLGHLVVEADGRECACGGFGCLDAYCSRRAIEEETGRAAQRAPRAIIERTGTLVGRALVSVGAVVDLKIAIIGGTLALGYGDVFFDAVRHEVETRARLGHLQGFSVAPVALGHHAPLVGAAALARSLPVVPGSRPPAAPPTVEGPAVKVADRVQEPAPPQGSVRATAR